jgi:iron complex outermembrane receptor protein
VVGMGFSVYANASYNIARLTSDDSWVPLTPNRLSAIGLLYHAGPWQGSLIERYVGRRYGDAEDAYPLGGYGTADFAINYLLGPWGALKNAKVGVTMENITDRKSIYFLNGYSAGSTPPGYINGNPMFFTLPGRSVQLNLSASF